MDDILWALLLKSCLSLHCEFHLSKHPYFNAEKLSFTVYTVCILWYNKNIKKKREEKVADSSLVNCIKRFAENSRPQHKQQDARDALTPPPPHIFFLNFIKSVLIKTVKKFNSNDTDTSVVIIYGTLTRKKCVK
jgi:hypothetical protein